MDDLQRAIKWLEFMQESGYETEAEQQHCRALLDALKENERLKEELTEYAETFCEQNNALSDNVIANARLKAKIDAVRDIALTTGLMSDQQSYIDGIDKIWRLLENYKDGDSDAICAAGQDNEAGISAGSDRNAHERAAKTRAEDFV